MHTPRRLASKVIIVVVAAGLLALAAILLTPSPSTAEPVVRWEPTVIIENITPGASKTIAVSFVSSEDVADVAVRVVPELTSLVQTDPTSFAGIAQGQTMNLSLTITAAPSSLPGTFDGTIQLRSGDDPKKMYAKPLPISLMIFIVETDPEEVLDKLIIDLKAGNIEDTLPRLAIASQHIERIRSLDQDGLDQLADSLANRRLLTETPTLRVYTGPWIDDNGAHRDVEFTMTLTKLGKWVIISL